MKKKLLEHNGDMTITEDNSRKNITTYNPKVSSIFRKYYCKPKDVNVELEKIQLIEAAAAILQSEIKEKVSTTKDFYPLPEELSREDCLHYLPPLLRLLLTKMFSGIEAELKTATIGECIIQAVQPRSVIAPLQIGLAVQMYQHFRSRYLLDTLHRMGLSSSYKEAMIFERNAAVVCGSQLNGQVGEDNFIKFSADNMDHNLCTLAGKDTFHGMGMIVAISKGIFLIKPILRKDVLDKDLISEGRVKISNYREKKHILK